MMRNWEAWQASKSGAAMLLLLLILPSAVLGEEMIRIPFTMYGIDAGRPFHSPRGVFCDRGQDEILIADAGGGRVLIFDGEGWPKFEFIHWVERGGKRLPGEPAAVAATPDGNIFVVDVLSPNLHIVNFRGQAVRMITPSELLPQASGTQLSPCLAVGPDGQVFAVCRTDDGHFLVSMSATGDVLARLKLGETGDLVQVTGLAIDTDRIYLSDLAADSCVQVFDRAGRRQLAFGIHDTGWGNFSFPAAIAVTSGGHIWVVDQIRQIVNHFDAKGNFLGYIGGSGFGPGSMSYPCAVARDKYDRILVLEKVGRRCQAFVLPKGGDAASITGA